MRAWKVLVLLVAVAAGPVNSFGQDLKTAYYANLYSQLDGSPASHAATLGAFYQKLERKRDKFKNESDFVRHIFERTHQQFLKQYTDYASFNALFENNGTYNCLTGTALLALALDNLEVSYRIVETNYHIFILAQTADGDVLLESTDPANGFVHNAEAIAARIEQYRTNTLTQKGKAKVYYRYAADIYNDVNLDQLAGLMHYNMAIVAYNQQHLSDCISHLGKALELHPSPRIEEFSHIIVLSVQQSNLEVGQKEKYLKNLQVLRTKQLAVTASAQ